MTTESGSPLEQCGVGSEPEPVRLYAGIDPGANGAVALVHENGRLCAVWDAADPMAWDRYPHAANPVTLAAVEEAGTMPQQGRASLGKQQRAIGEWRGWLLGRGIPHIMVRARDWQRGIVPARKAVHAPGEKPKTRTLRRKEIADAVWEYAMRRWPDAPLVGPRGGRLYDRACALCIADHTRGRAVGEGKGRGNDEATPEAEKRGRR